MDFRVILPSSFRVQSKEGGPEGGGVVSQRRAAESSKGGWLGGVIQDQR